MGRLEEYVNWESPKEDGEWLQIASDAESYFVQTLPGDDYNELLSVNFIDSSNIQVRYGDEGIEAYGITGDNLSPYLKDAV